jgi:uncharacterized protein with von Willebrand factor type A (vWA) domain
MPAEISSPLQSIVKRLAATQVEGPAARLKARFEDATDNIVVLADCSGSMEDLIGSQNMRKCDHLRIALEDVLLAFPKIKLIAFHFTAKVITDAARLREPQGGTNMAAALRLAQKFKPRKTIVISDGLPDNERAALKAADELTGAIDTIYCGPDAHPAAEFLRKLSRSSGGVSVLWDGMRTGISQTIRGLLPAPE